MLDSTTKPEKWYFDIIEGEGFWNGHYCLTLSMIPGEADQSFYFTDLPKRFQKKLGSISDIKICKYAFPQPWRIDTSKTKDEIIDAVKALGFKHHPLNLDHNHMKYSKDPQDWYFDVQDNGDVLALALSTSPEVLDDELGSHNLPKAIADLLAPVGVYTEAELMESVWEIPETTKTVEELIAEIKALGFNHTFAFRV